MDSVHLVTVKIFGEEYRIKGDEDPERIQQLARYVDEKIRAVREKMVSVHPVKVAVLASLNIADELFAERLETERSLEEMKAGLTRCRALLSASRKEG